MEIPETKLLKIGEVSKATGVAISALRYYEELDLVQAQFKNDSKYRFYKDSDIALVKFIKKSQYLGFSLNEIKSILNERKQGKSPCPMVRKFAQEKVQTLQKQIQDLQKLEKELNKYIVEASKELEGQFKEAKICGLIENASS